MFNRREVVGGGSLAFAASATLPAADAVAAEGVPVQVRTRIQTGAGMTIDMRLSGGTGRAIVLIHGLGQSHLAWNTTARGLGLSSPIVAYDQRGHGGSTKLSDVVAYSDGALWANDLREVLTAFGGLSPIVVGWSLGGLVLTHYLALHSDAALGGVVFVSAVTDPSPALMTSLAKSLLKNLCDTSMEERVASAPDFVDASFATVLPAVQRTGMIVANASVPTAVYQAVAALPPADPTLLSRISVPTLVIHGLRDALVSPDMARRSAAAIPHADLRLYERSGHGPLIDEPARLASDISAFAASLG